MRFLTLAVSALALGACHHAAQQQHNEQAADEATSAAQPGPVKGVDRSHRGTPAPAAAFNEPSGAKAVLKDFAGKPVLLNLWASWCAPCVKELPTLDALARSDSNVSVVAVSQDTADQASVIAFLKQHGIATLQPYHDPNMALSGALGPDTVLPTSILFDAHGREVWRYVGDLDWTSRAAAKLLSEAGAAAPAR